MAQTDQPGSGLERDGMHVPHLAGPLDALAEPFNFSLGGAGQATMDTFLQPIGDSAAQQIWSDFGSRGSVSVAP